MRSTPSGATALILFFSFGMFAKEQRLTFDQDADVYELVFDDGRISASQMREAAWLSPYVSAPPAPFELASSQTRRPDGTVALDKVFVAPWLELCTAVAPARCQAYDPLVPNADFMRNAAKN